LDLFLVTSRQDITFTSLNAVLLIIGRCPVDVRVVQRSEVDELMKRFNAWARQPRQPRNATAFTNDERKLLHRLRSGQALFGSDQFLELQNQIELIDLARHRLDYAQYFASTIQVDLAGLRSAGDQYSMLFAAQELLGHTVDALLAAYKYSNSNSKWRVRQLTDLPAEWELELPGRRSGMSARDLYLSLHSTPRSSSPKAILDYSLRIVAFARRVFPWAEYRLLSPASLPLSSANGSDMAGGRPLPHLDLDVTVRYQKGKFELLRLNGKGEIFLLSPREYSLLCLFDGVTSREDAIREAEQTLNEAVGVDFVSEMEALVRHGDFEARNFVDGQALKAILRTASS
jgi:hypothetical protein